MTRPRCCDFFGNLHEFIKGYYRVLGAPENYSDCFKVCMDTGHVHKATRFGNPSVGDAIRLLGNNIVCLHLHDNDKWKDSHQIPFSMNIDFTAVTRALKEIGYSGWVTLEAYNYLKDFTPETAFQGIRDLSAAARRLADMLK